MSEQAVTERQQYWLDHILAADAVEGSLIEYAKAEGQRPVPVEDDIRSPRRDCRQSGQAKSLCRGAGATDDEQNRVAAAERRAAGTLGQRRSADHEIAAAGSERACVIRPFGDASIHLYRHPVGVRKAISGPVSTVEGELDPFSADLFIFCNRARNLVKTVTWEGYGYSERLLRIIQRQIQGRVFASALVPITGVGAMHH